MGKKKKGKKGDHAARESFKKNERGAKRAYRKKRDRDAWKGEWQSFCEQVAQFGLRLKNVEPDGNCLFRSVGDQLEGNEHRCGYYRDETVDFMDTNRESFEPFVPTGIEEEFLDFDEYLKDMRKNGTWGGNLELQGVSQRFVINIVVHHLNAPRYEIWNHVGVPTIHLSYHNGQHYASVRNKKDGAGQATPIDLKVAKPSLPPSHVKDPSKDGLKDAANKKENIVSEMTGCRDFEKIREILKYNFDDLDATVEYLVMEQANGLDDWDDGNDQLEESKHGGGTTPSETFPTPEEERQEEQEQPAQKRKTPKPKSNCPCNSGKKYKRCCMPMDRLAKKQQRSAIARVQTDDPFNDEWGECSNSYGSRKGKKEKLTNKQRKERNKQRKREQNFANCEPKSRMKQKNQQDENVIVEDLGALAI